MAVGCYSEPEKAFILHGVEVDFRYDGRARSDYRPIELETDIVPHASGSARLRLANTDILVGVKVEIDKTSVKHPDEGKLEFFVDCSANATPAFEGRGGEDLANELSGALARAYAAPQALDLKALCILPGYQCWKLYVDVLVSYYHDKGMQTFVILVPNSANFFWHYPGYSLGFSKGFTIVTASDIVSGRPLLDILPRIQCPEKGGPASTWHPAVTHFPGKMRILECGGNLFDALGLGVKAALRNTLIPRVTAAALDGADPELILSDDPNDCWKLDISNAPVLVSVIKVGECCVVDPGAEEEAVSGGGVLVAYGGGLVKSIMKLGGGSLHPNTLKEMIQLGMTAGEYLEKSLDDALQREEELGPKREKAGFLK